MGRRRAGAGAHCSPGLGAAPSSPRLDLEARHESVESPVPARCEHAFVSIKGRNYTWFRKALEKGDLATVRSTLSSLPPLTLEDALSVALLICGSEPENAERAAVRWLRKLLDRPGVRLADVRQALDAFALLVEDAASAEATLTELAATHR